MKTARPLALTMLTVLAALCAAGGQPAELLSLERAAAQVGRVLLDGITELVDRGDAEP